MLPLSPQELFAQAQQLIAQLQQVAGVPSEGEPVPVDNRIKLVMGQDYPSPPQGQRWPMSNRALYEAVASLGAQVQVLTELLAATRADVYPRLLLAQAAADKSLANDAANAAAALAAQTKADADAVLANQALALAQAAQASQALLAARFRVARLASPAIALGATGSLLITWQPAFADANYSVVAECEGAALLGLVATVSARTATGCTVQLKNGLGLNLTLGAGTISLVATHD